MELTNVSRQEESNANELSKPVSTLIPEDIDLITNSNDNNLLAVGKRDIKTCGYTDTSRMTRIVSNQPGLGGT